jgi:hypothetical protein
LLDGLVAAWDEAAESVFHPVPAETDVLHPDRPLVDCRFQDFQDLFPGDSHSQESLDDSHSQESLDDSHSQEFLGDFRSQEFLGDSHFPEFQDATLLAWFLDVRS